MDKTLLIEKVIAGKASPEEQKELDEWLLASTENRDEFEDMKWLTKAGDHHIEWDRDDAFYDGLRRIQKKIRAIRKRQKRMRIIKIIILALMLSLGLYLLFHWLGKRASSQKDWSIHIEREHPPNLIVPLTDMKPPDVVPRCGPLVV